MERTLEAAGTVSFHFVMRRRKMFSEVISGIGGTRGPVKTELFVGNTMTEPMVAHIECLGAFHVDLGLKNIVGSRIVSFKRGAISRLRVTHFGESSDKWDGLLSVEEETASFGFSGGSGDAAESLAENMYRTIGIRRS